MILVGQDYTHPVYWVCEAESTAVEGWSCWPDTSKRFLGEDSRLCVLR